MTAVSGQTRLFGIFGDPVGHTLSPTIHNAAFDALHLPYLYVPFRVSPQFLSASVAAILPLGIRGINITIPHKETVLAHLDHVTEEASAIGAVNTIEVVSGRLIGHNTDGKGFMRSLSESGVSPMGWRVILLGAGGAARAVAVSLIGAGVSEVIIMARTRDRADKLADTLSALSQGASVSVLTSTHMLPEKQGYPTLLINATPLGMKDDDPLPFPATSIEPHWVVADIVYSTGETPLLMAAKRMGARTVPGTGMLLHQAAITFEIWTGRPAPLEAMRSAASSWCDTHKGVSENRHERRETEGHL